MANILDIPPRLLRLFVDLIETSSVSRSAANLGLSQPAASRGLAQLRDALGDPLFIRSGRGLAATPAALRLAPQIRATLHQIERLPFSASAAPKDFSGVARVATTDYGALVALSPALPGLAEKAPGLAVDVVPLDGQVFQKLLEGRLDLAFYADDETPSGIAHADLFSEEHVFIVARDHPLARKDRPTRADIDAYPHLLVTIYGDRGGYVDDGALGTARPGLWVPYFTTAPMMLARGPMVMAIPRRAAESLQHSAGLKILPLTPEIRPFTYRLLWARSFERDPVIDWLRRQIIETFTPKD